MDKVSTGIEYNCLRIINRNFSYRKFQKDNFFKIYNFKMGLRILKNLSLSIYNFFPGFAVSHLPTSFLKKTFDDVWEKCGDELIEVSSHKFRKNTDLSQWLFQYWQFASGNFYQRNWNFGKYYNVGSDFTTILDDVLKGKHKLICINDDGNVNNFEIKKKQLIDVFEKRYPIKSSFEK